MKANKRWRGWMLCGMILMTAGLIAFSISSFRQNRLTEKAASLLNSLEIPAEASDPHPLYIDNPKMMMPLAELEGRNYFGKLEIPALNMTMPLLASTDNGGLGISICRFTGSLYQDNLALCGQNSRAFFGRLHRMRIGDAIRITDLEGHRFLFEVCEIVTVRQAELDEALADDWDLTLFSDRKFGDSTVIVRCERIK